LALSLAEREEISRAVVAGQSIDSVAKVLGRAPSTISREAKRNGGQQCYRATQADWAWALYGIGSVAAYWSWGRVMAVLC